MKSKFILVLFLCIGLGMKAQTAKSILDKASTAYDNAGGISASFTLNIKDTNKKETYSSDGKAWLRGDKFKLETPDGITWFDGKTQWVYIKDSDEVNVTNPTGEELKAISPVAMFNMYKHGFTLTSKGQKVVKGKTVLEVEMTPQKKGQDVSKIVVQVDKANNIFYSITVFDKSGIQTELLITKIQVGINMTDPTFVFNKKDYPTAEVIDLR